MHYLLRLFIPLMVVLVSGCSPKYSDFFPYHDDGSPKPYVVMLPVRDNSHSGLPWNVGDEFTTGIRYRLMQDGRIFMPAEKEIRRVSDSISTQEMFSDQLSVATRFKPANYVVFLELIEHKIEPYKRGQVKPLYPASLTSEQADVLLMKLRLRMIDLRGDKPRIVRQEILESNHMVPKDCLQEAERLHGTDIYKSTSLALAHARLIRDVASTIDRSVLLHHP